MLWMLLPSWLALVVIDVVPCDRLVAFVGDARKNRAKSDDWNAWVWAVLVYASVAVVSRQSPRTTGVVPLDSSLFVSNHVTTWSHRMWSPPRFVRDENWGQAASY